MTIDDTYRFVTNEKGEKVEDSLSNITLFETEMGQIWMPVTYKFKAVELTAEQVRSAFDNPIKIANGLGVNEFFFVERAIFSVICQTIPFTGGGDFGIFFNQKEIAATALGQSDKICNSVNVQLDSVSTDSDQIRGSKMYFSNLGSAFKGGDGKLRIEFFYRELF